MTMVSLEHILFGLDSFTILIDRKKIRQTDKKKKSKIIKNSQKSFARIKTVLIDTKKNIARDAHCEWRAEPNSSQGFGY